VPARDIEGFRLIVNTRGERGHRPHVHVVRAGTKVQIVLDETLTPYNVKA